MALVGLQGSSRADEVLSENQKLALADQKPNHVLAINRLIMVPADVQEVFFQGGMRVELNELKANQGYCTMRLHSVSGDGFSVQPREKIRIKAGSLAERLVSQTVNGKKGCRNLAEISFEDDTFASMVCMKAFTSQYCPMLEDYQLEIADIRNIIGKDASIVRVAK